MLAYLGHHLLQQALLRAVRADNVQYLTPREGGHVAGRPLQLTLLKVRAGQAQRGGIRVHTAALQQQELLPDVVVALLRVGLLRLLRRFRL